MSAELWTDVVALLQIAFIDLVLAGDNAIVVGLAVAGLASEHRRKAILLGLGGAVILRILFSIVALNLLEVLGLTLAGGILLVWVAYKLYRELRSGEGGGLGSGWFLSPSWPAPRSLWPWRHSARRLIELETPRPPHRC